ncbi:DegT/DnrJ/EryC1/StrS aminotransferase family protein [Streptomyces venezuelae]|uniref:Aminotransferase DegT n=1 Tax=Streptomyces venezuelae TaxID=54571 RepID=A0A5P2BWB7_STRVZ|nr:DegT/DnrJ/EryC1/StrS family aminotransferase [Streptomyces venezuelae]QES34507.1 aminotransferase DegT [Streptomyces venezuelae]
MTIGDIPKLGAFRKPGKEYVVPYLPVGSVVGDREIAAVTRVLRSGETLSGGGRREEFERNFRDYVGAPYAMSTTSGTVTLELAIHLLGLRPGDEVIVTPQTYQASIQPLLQYPDVEVTFCDVRQDTLNMDPRCLERLIGPRTRAVILVHYGGHPADMHEIMDIARAHDALVIEDSAHALGSVYHGARPGALADIGCFSFHSSKNITTLGEGGMLTFADPEWAERVDRLRGNEVDGSFLPRRHTFGDSKENLPGGLYPGNAYTHDLVALRKHGTNATLPEAAAAMGTSQLRALPGMVERRRAIAARLRETLGRFPGLVEAPEAPEGVIHSQHLFTFFVREGTHGINRHRLLHELDHRGVQVPLRYFPLHLLPEWRARGHRYGECPTAERVWFHEQVNLPCHPALSVRQVDLLCDRLEESLRAACTH